MLFQARAARGFTKGGPDNYTDCQKSKLGLIYPKEKIWEPLPTELECFYDNPYILGNRYPKQKPPIK